MNRRWQLQRVGHGAAQSEERHVTVTRDCDTWGKPAVIVSAGGSNEGGFGARWIRTSTAAVAAVEAASAGRMAERVERVAQEVTREVREATAAVVVAEAVLVALGKMVAG